MPPRVWPMQIKNLLNHHLKKKKKKPNEIKFTFICTFRKIFAKFAVEVFN